MRSLEFGAELREQQRPVEAARLLPALQPVDDVVDRPQQGHGGRVSVRRIVLAAGHPVIDPRMGEIRQSFAVVRDTGAVLPAGVAVGALDPAGDVGMRQMVDAHARDRGNLHHTVGQQLDPRVHDRGERDRTAAEAADVVFRPVIGPLVMDAQDVVPQRQGVDVRARRLELRLQEADRFRAEAFVVVQEQHPVMAALRQGEGARVLDGRGPGHRQHAIRMPCRHRARVVGRRLVHHDQLVREGERAQAGADQGGTVVRDDEGAQFGAAGWHGRDPVLGPAEHRWKMVNAG